MKRNPLTIAQGLGSPSKIAKTCNLTVGIYRQNNDFAKCHYFLCSFAFFG